MLFSIIVPVYKVEKYLPHCIDSIIQQSYKDFELILVNDGSPDNSGKICDQYAELDKRIHVIHKQNGGVSDARNVGLSIAQGEFIWFLDSDDLLVDSALKNVAELIKKSEQELDMITCSHINYYNNGDRKLAFLPVDNYGVMSRNDYLSHLYNSRESYWAPWKNIYRRSIITVNKLLFPEGLTCAEDFDFYIRYILKGKSFLFLNNPTVYYRIDREGSITSVMPKKAIMDQLIVYSRNFDIFEEETTINKKMQVFLANKFANTISLLGNLEDENENDISELTNFIRMHKLVLKKTKGIKYKIAKILWVLFNYYRGSKLLKTLNRR